MVIVNRELYEDFLEKSQSLTLTDDEKKCLASFASISHFINRWLTKLDAVKILHEYQHFDYQQIISALNDISLIDDEEIFLKELRKLKYRELIKIAIRDVNDINSIKKTLEELSLLASAIIDTANRWVGRWFKDSPVLSIIAMGKLGAMELNFSSDVDLVYVHEDCDLEFVETLNKKAVKLNKVLGTMTDFGFLYRVDNELRPGGKFSPLAMSNTAIMDYYLIFGEAWQRVALLRARFLSGNAQFVEGLLKELQPFIFTKYLDYSLLNELRKLKERINNESLKKGSGEINIKLGKGGIREAEFFVQVLQIINGGKNVNLRKLKFSDIVNALAEGEIITKSDGKSLKEAYYFLRKVENAVQMEEESQEYVLPKDGRALSFVARRCGFSDVGLFLDTLERHRSVISKFFDNLFEEKIKVKEVALDDDKILKLIPEDILSDKDVKECIEKFIQLKGQIPSKYKEGYAKLLYQLIDNVLQRPNGKKLILELDSLINLLLRRPIYIPLLTENPLVIQKLLDCYDLGTFFTKIILNHPETLDYFISDWEDVERGTVKEYRKILKRIVEGVEEFENKMYLLRQFKNSEWLNIVLARYRGTIDNRTFESFLTNLAEAILLTVVDICNEVLSARYGEIKQDFVILGLGKLGTGEMNIHSDLDLIFIYRSDDERAAFYNTKLLQRVITALSVTTKEGFLYNVDMRLRPTGSQGPLVTSFESFCRYHEESAWLFEKQALTKARVLGEKTDLALEVAGFLERNLYERDYEPTTLKREIKRMKYKMEEEMLKNHSTVLNIKVGKGGLVDIEFIVQFFKLLYGKRYKELRVTNTTDFFSAFQRTKLFDEEKLERLKRAYEFLKDLETGLRICYGYPKSEINLAEEIPDGILPYINYEKSMKRRFIRDLKETTKAVRKIFDEIFL